MVSKIIATLALLVLMPIAAHSQQPQRGRGDGQRGSSQRGQSRAPATYYGGGVYGPGRQWRGSDQRWRGAPAIPGGRYWRGQYYSPGVGPCWIAMPVVGWVWTCGP